MKMIAVYALLLLQSSAFAKTYSASSQGCRGNFQKEEAPFNVTNPGALELWDNAWVHSISNVSIENGKVLSATYHGTHRSLKNWKWEGGKQIPLKWEDTHFTNTVTATAAPFDGFSSFFRGAKFFDENHQPLDISEVDGYALEFVAMNTPFSVPELRGDALLISQAEVGSGVCDSSRSKKIIWKNGTDLSKLDWESVAFGNDISHEWNSISPEEKQKKNLVIWHMPMTPYVTFE